MQVDRSHLFTQREQYSAPSAPGHTQPRTPDGRTIRPRLLISAITACLLPAVALAGPKNGQVVAGNASIQVNGKKTVIRQRSDRSAINWERFSIGRKEYVKFIQPKKSSISLNRVVGGDPSKILGKMSANGQVFLVNPNGIYFGEGARVDVSGIVASVLDISDADFMSGKFVFEGDLDENLGEVINNGIINARDQGYVVLMGDYAENNGVIQAQMGKVVLASGSRVTMDISGNSLISVAVDEAAVSDLAGVKNTGEIYADGGRVIMTAKVADDLIGSAVNNQGLIRASSIVAKGGSIFLTASGGDVVNSGVLDASAADDSNADGGGVLVYSDRNVTLTSTSEINARGDGRGAGGTVRVIAQDNLDFQSGAAISVAGKPHHGGFVEVSGHSGLRLRGQVDLGSGGTLLIDPSTFTINTGSNAPSGDTSGSVGKGFLQTQLNDGNDVFLVADTLITASAPMTISADNAGAGDLNLVIGTISGGGTLGAPTNSSQCNSYGYCLGDGPDGTAGGFKINPDPTGDILLGNVRFNLDGRLNVAAGTMSGSVSLGTVFDAARLDVAGGSATGSVTLDNVEVDGKINITTGEDINFQGRVERGGGGLTATAGNDILVDGGIGSDGTFEGPGPFNGPVNLNADNDVIVNEDIYAGANNINLNADVDGNGSGDVDINGSGSCSDGCFGERRTVLTTGNLRVTGQNFNVNGADFGGGVVSTDMPVPVTVKANRVIVDIAGDMNVKGGRVDVNADGFSGPRSADVSVKVTGTSGVKVTANNMTVQGGTAIANASGSGSTYGAAQATADARASVTGADMTLDLGGTLDVSGGRAAANVSGSCTDCSASADARARISGDDVTMKNIGGDLNIQGGSADALADATCDTCSVVAGASAEIRGDKVSIKSLAGNLNVVGQSDSARAELSGSMASGFARANAGARLSAATDLSADVGGLINVIGGNARADGYWIDASKMDARANADATIEAGGNLRVTAAAGLNVIGGTASATPTTAGTTSGRASASAKAEIKAGKSASVEVTEGSVTLTGGSSNPSGTGGGTSYSGSSPRSARASGSSGIRRASASAIMKADQLGVKADQDIVGSNAAFEANGIRLHAGNTIYLHDTETRVGNGVAPGASGDPLVLEVYDVLGVERPNGGNPNLLFHAGDWISLGGNSEIKATAKNSYLWFDTDWVSSEVHISAPQGPLHVQYSPTTVTNEINIEHSLFSEAQKGGVAFHDTGTPHSGYDFDHHIKFIPNSGSTVITFGGAKQTGRMTVGLDGKIDGGSRNFFLLTIPDDVNSPDNIEGDGNVYTSSIVASVEPVFITPRLENFEVETDTLWDEEEERKKRLVETQEEKHGMCTAL